MKLLIASDKPQFTGLFNKQKTVDFETYSKNKHQRVVNERLHATQNWYSNQIKQTMPN
jgi:hypothetical protein